MRVQVLYFAVVRERLEAGRGGAGAAGGGGCRGGVAGARAAASALGGLRAAVKLAVNEEFVAGDRVLADGDVIALIPPVAGGAGLFRVSDEPLSLDEVVRAVSSDEQGGVVTFTGVVRRQSRGKRIVRLEYEAYRPMAERKLAEIGAQLAAEQPGVRVAIVHRVGKLAVGERRRGHRGVGAPSRGGLRRLSRGHRSAQRVGADLEEGNRRRRRGVDRPRALSSRHQCFVSMLAGQGWLRRHPRQGSQQRPGAGGRRSRLRGRRRALVAQRRCQRGAEGPDVPPACKAAGVAGPSREDGSDDRPRLPAIPAHPAPRTRLRRPPATARPGRSSRRRTLTSATCYPIRSIDE